MEALAYRLRSLSSSEVALLLVALQYAVLAPAWVVAAMVLPADRRAAGWWGAYAAGSALGLLMIVGGMHQGDVVLRAGGNVLVVVATLALQRGLWSFTDQPRWNLTQAALALATLVCERARSLPLVTDDGRLALTISVGVAEWLGSHDSRADLLRRADTALYCAEHEGRDQVRRGGLVALEVVQAA